MAYCPPELLDDLADVLTTVRGWARVIEKKRGVFYVGRQPFLHFHLAGGQRRRADVKGLTSWVQIDLPRPATATRRRALVRELQMRYGEKTAATQSGREPAVVLDTNVFVAAGFNPRSASARIVDTVRQQRLPMVWNDATRREIERIMRQIPPLRAHRVAELFRPANRFTAPTHRERFAQVPDPDDRKFAALAHAAGAILISNDEHLLGYRGREDLTVLTPAAFWKRQRPRW